MKSIRLFLPAFLVAMFCALPLQAAAPQYDASTEATLEGSALYAANHPTGASWTGLYVIMRDGSRGEIEVHLAPATFLEEKGVLLKTGDSLRVVGSRTRWNGNEIILAREVTVSGKTVALRDKDGKPRW